MKCSSCAKKSKMTPFKNVIEKFLKRLQFCLFRAIELESNDQNGWNWDPIFTSDGYDDLQARDLTTIRHALQQTIRHSSYPSTPAEIKTNKKLPRCTIQIKFKGTEIFALKLP